MKRFKLGHMTVGGTQYFAISLIAQIAEFDDLDLVPEPENIYDPDAVRVDWQDHRIGYVPREYAQIIASLLANGFRVEATVDYAGAGMVTMDIWMFR